MRVLHLIDGGFRGAGGGVETERAMLACRGLVACGGHQQSVCLLGPRAAVRRAERLGLWVDWAIAPTLGLPESGWRAVRRLVAATGRPDLVNCWGVREARLALRAVGDSLPRVAVLPDGAAGPADLTVTCSEAGRSRLEGSGVEIGRVMVAPPPVWADSPGERESLRQQLGVDEDVVLIAQLGGPPQADAMRFSFLIGLLREVGVRAFGVMHATAAHRARAAGFARRIRQTRVAAPELPWPRVLRACDLAVFDGGGPGPTKDWPAAPWAGPPAIAPAHAAGLPVVAPAWAVEGPGLHPECAAYNSTLPELARRLTALIEDAGLRTRIGREVRSLFEGRPESDGFVQGVQEAWEEALSPVAEGAHG